MIKFRLTTNESQNISMYQKFQFFSDEEPYAKDVAAQNLHDEDEDDDEEGGEGGKDEGGFDNEDAFFSIDPNKVRVEKVRLDKWLWAARFFKTRPLARIEVEAGNVLYNGEVTKPSREIELNAVLKIRQRRCERTVIIRGLSTRRRSKEEALLLFEETLESKQIRDRQQEWQPKQEYHQQSSSFGFSPYGKGEERRPVRFLRRSFGRNAQQPLSQESPPLYPGQHQHSHHHHQHHNHHQQHHQQRSPYSSPYHHNHQAQPTRSHQSSHSHYPSQPQNPYPPSPYARTQKPRHQTPPKSRNPQYVDQEFIEPLE